MILVMALATGVLFGSGAYLMLKGDLLRVVAGVVLISNAANLFIIAAGLSRGRAPIYPLATGQSVSDPLVQALILTAIVITFGMTALLVSLLFRMYTAYQSVDQEVIAQMEARDEREAAEYEWADDRV